MTKPIFILITFFLTTGQLLACGGAYQCRLFPIGTTNDKLVIIETSLNRYWGADTAGVTIETRNRWKGVITLKTMDKQGQLETLQLIDTVDILDRDYSKELKAFFDTAFSISSKLTDFQPADIPTIEFCNFKEECEIIDLISSTADTLTTKTKDEKEFKISFPQTVIQESETSGGMTNQTFKINSIRTIIIGRHKLIVANFASGEEHNTDFTTQTKDLQPCESIADCVYKEVTLYHGLSFDAIIWN